MTSDKMKRSESSIIFLYAKHGQFLTPHGYFRDNRVSFCPHTGTFVTTVSVSDPTRVISWQPCQFLTPELNKGSPLIELLSLWTATVQAESLLMTRSRKRRVEDSVGQFLHQSLLSFLWNYERKSKSFWGHRFGTFKLIRYVATDVKSQTERKMEWKSTLSQ